MQNSYQLFDISQPISSLTACFPGDTPFSKQVTVSLQEGNSYNLTAFAMSPHVGTHADAPLHVAGSYQSDTGIISGAAGEMPLYPFLGPAVVIDLSPFSGAITVSAIEDKLGKYLQLAPRVLFKTSAENNCYRFEENYPYLAEETINYLGQQRVSLIGIDAPSVDHIKSKTLVTHQALLSMRFAWLENLDLNNIEEGEYFLIALPLKFVELEASPVRAVLLKET